MKRRSITPRAHVHQKKCDPSVRRKKSQSKRSSNAAVKATPTIAPVQCPDPLCRSTLPASRQANRCRSLCVSLSNILHLLLTPPHATRMGRGYSSGVPQGSAILSNTARHGTNCPSRIAPSRIGMQEVDRLVAIRGIFTSERLASDDPFHNFWSAVADF